MGYNYGTQKRQVMRFGSDVRTYSQIQLNKSLKIPLASHDALLEFLQERAMTSRYFTNPMVDRFTEIDKELAGHIVPTKEDRQRIRMNQMGQGPKLVDENIQFALLQLDEAVTYLCGVIAATPGMYQAITVKDKQQIANAFASVMNDHARQFKHYRALAKGLLDMLKFNMGGFVTEWTEERGPRIKGSLADGSPDISLDDYLKVGNKLIPIDPYNFLFDPAVSPIDLGDKGEFFGMVDTIRPFTLRQLEAAGDLFQVDRLYNSQQPAFMYYKRKPEIQHYYAASGGRTNWDSYWTSSYGPDLTFDPEALERTVMYCWVNPTDFKLSASKTPQIWRFWIINNCAVVRADQMTNVHNKLPISIGMPNEDGLNLQSRTFAEMLLPFQRFASAQLNIHQRAQRKRMYGLTIYNRRIIPLMENADIEGGKIPANPTGAGEVNLNNQVVQLNDAPDVSRTMDDVSSALGFMARILPATQPSQVADLDRATRYQAAALIQATNKRNQKLAKLIDDQCLDESRRQMMLNIMQFQPAVEVIDEASGAIVQINPQQFREIKIEFAIADGMRGTDKLLITDSLREVINMLLQSKVADQYDMGSIINYYLEMQGDKLDFTQFKYQSPMDALPPQFKNMALQALMAELQKSNPQAAQQLAQMIQQSEPQQPGQPPQQPQLAPPSAPGQTSMGTSKGQGA